MEGFIHRDQRVELDKTEVDKRSFTFSSTGCRFHINFNFSCKSSSCDWVLHQGSTRPQLCKMTKLPRMETLVQVNPDQLWCDAKAHEIIGEELRNWPVWADKLRSLIVAAINKARVMVEHMPRHHNYVSLHFPVDVLNVNVFDEDGAIRWATQRSMEEDDHRVRMVPALESSIESLEKKTLMDCGTNCSVCLEEVLRGCEGLVMPCLHVFHEDCIKEWLRTSYYCPVCRFEMPKRVVLNLE